MNQPELSIVDAKYEILAYVGGGGMGAVYKARQKSLDRIVAVKILSASLVGDESQQRFEREALAISSLKHRNILLFYGYGVHDKKPYLVTEFVDGRTLFDDLYRYDTLPPTTCLKIAQQVCAALSCAHANAIIHRDLKPSNIMLVPAGDDVIVKLIDFGLVKLLPDFGKPVQQVTSVGETVGSVLYMSPEQCLGEKVDSRSDIYSLACIVYHCLTGDSPFSGDHYLDVMRKHIDEEPAPLQKVCPNTSFPPGLQEVLQKAMSKDADKRYQTADEFANDIGHVLNGTPEKISCGLAPSSAVIPEPKKSKLKSKMSLAIAAATLALFLAVYVGYIHSKTPPRLEKNSRDYYREADDLKHDYAENRNITLRRDVLCKALELQKQDGLMAPSAVLTARLLLADCCLKLREPKQAQQQCEAAMRAYLGYHVPPYWQTFLTISATMTEVRGEGDNIPKFAKLVDETLDHAPQNGNQRRDVDQTRSDLALLYLHIGDPAAARDVIRKIDYPTVTTDKNVLISMLIFLDDYRDKAEKAQRDEIINAKSLVKIPPVPAERIFKAESAKGYLLPTVWIRVAMDSGDWNKAERWRTKIVRPKKTADGMYDGMDLLLAAHEQDWDQAAKIFREIMATQSSRNYYALDWDMNKYAKMLDAAQRTGEAQRVRNSVLVLNRPYSRVLGIDCMQSR